MNIQNNANLVAPLVPAADENGLIKTSDLNNDIMIHFPIWPGANSGDTYQLLVNQALIGNPVSIPVPFPGDGVQVSLAIPIATQLREDGLHNIQYQATHTENGVAENSAVTTIRIDRTAPGAALLAPAIFAAVNFGDTLHGKIPGYTGMAAGDAVQTLCNGAEGPFFIVQPEHLIAQPLEVSLSREFLEGLASQKVVITYQVSDRAGNKSILAQPTELTLGL